VPPKNGRPGTTVTPAPGDLIRTKEVAEILCTTTNAVYVMRTRGIGPPAYRVGRHLLFSRSEVLAWLGRNREDPETVAS
jgi:excisionase family DNA binding protein